MVNPELQADINPQLLREMRLAYATISQRDSPVLRTEIIQDEELSDRFGQGTTVVTELHQPGKSFKLRGAYNFFKSLTRAQLENEVVTVSAGNHAQGIALCSKLFGVKSHIFMPNNTPINKIDRVTELGGELIEIHPRGSEFDESLKFAQSYSEKQGAAFSSPFDDIKVIAGQATLGMEIYQDVPNIGAVFCPVGGMGLLAGISASLKDKDPSIRIIGVEPEGAASLQHAREQGKPSPLKGEFSTYVDGAAVREVGKLPFELTNHLVDDVISVSDSDLREVTTELWGIDKSWSWLVRTELAGALAIAGLRRYGPLDLGNKFAVCLVTGGNLSQERFEKEVRV